MVTCRQLSERATEYMDGVMPIAERWRFGLHLLRCSGCRAYLQQMRVTVQALGRLQGEPAQSSTRAAVLQHFRSTHPAQVSAQARAQRSEAAWPQSLADLVRGHRGWLVVLLSLCAPVVVLAVSGFAVGEAGHGMMCLGMELMLGAGSLVSILWLSRRARVDTAGVVAVAALGAVAGYVPAELACDMNQVVAHVLLFHVGGIALAGMAGLAASRLVVAR